jgi:hypothetical protein
LRALEDYIEEHGWVDPTHTFSPLRYDAPPPSTTDRGASVGTDRLEQRPDTAP